MIEMIVEGIAIDSVNKTILLLSNLERSVYLPIWVGPAEAMAIQIELEQKNPPRPMSHDLMNNILIRLDALLLGAVVNEYRNTVYYATLRLMYQGNQYEIDSRPSDAIALALRAGVKIYAEESVLEEAGIPLEQELKDQPFVSGDEIDRFKKLIGEND